MGKCRQKGTLHVSWVVSGQGGLESWSSHSLARTLSSTPLCFFFVTQNRLSLVSSEKLKEPRERRGFGKWVNSCPKHSVCGTNTSRFVSLQGQSKVPYTSKVWLLLKSILPNQMASIPQNYQTDLLFPISQSAFVDNPLGSNSETLPEDKERGQGSESSFSDDNTQSKSFWKQLSPPRQIPCLIYPHISSP